MFSWFKKGLSLEQWANHNAKKATPDDLIAAAIVESFAKDHRHWRFIGNFEQRNLGYRDSFQSTSLSRKMSGKKHIEIVFTFKERTVTMDGYDRFSYDPMGCEVNGIPVTKAAFLRIYNGWRTVREAVKKAEEVAAKALEETKINESKWDLAESLLGMRRDGLGRLTVKGEEA